jgi:hypothetical protein
MMNGAATAPVNASEEVFKKSRRVGDGFSDVFMFQGYKLRFTLRCRAIASQQVILEKGFAGQGIGRKGGVFISKWILSWLEMRAGATAIAMRSVPARPRLAD